MGKITRKKAQDVILAAGVYSNIKHEYPRWSDLAAEQQNDLIARGKSIRFRQTSMGAPGDPDEYGREFYLSLLVAAGSPQRMVVNAFGLSGVIVEKMADAGATSVTDAEIDRCLANDPQKAMLTRAAKILAHAGLIEAEDVS